MKILVATDGSAHSKAMAKQFAERTFAPNTQVRIISAYDSSYMMYADPINASKDYYAKVDRNLRKLADNAAKNAAISLSKKNPRLSISTSAIEGSPKSVILEEAETFGADLIVVGSHGHGAIAGFLLSSVSQAVALHAKCSVEIIRNEKSKK